MKQIILIGLLALSSMAFSQSSNDTIQKTKHRIYSSGGGEFIFSFVNTNTDIEDPSMRFSAWFHLQMHWHYDLTNNLGVFWGLGSRNIGYITKPRTNDVFVKGFTVYDHNLNSGEGGYKLSNNYSSDQKITVIKRREYTIGIPLGFKVGNFDKNTFLFAGGEIEFPFNYKNKVWVDGKKVYKNSEWFSKQTQDYFLSAFVGVQMPWGMNLKFKWYFNDFMNNNYSTKEVYKDGTGQEQTVDVSPYSAFKSQVFYFSFGMNMFSSKKAVKQIQSIEKKEHQSYDL